MNVVKSNFKQLGVLLWKNYVLQKRSIVGLILEILLPMLFAIILLPIRSIVQSTNYSSDTNYDAFQLNQYPSILPKTPSYPAQKWFIGFTPSNNAILNQTMNTVASKCNFTAYG